MGDSCTQGTDNCHEPIARDGSQSEHLRNVLRRLRVSASGKNACTKAVSTLRNRGDGVFLNPIVVFDISHITRRVIENEEQRRKQIEIEHNNTRNVVPLL